MQLKYAYVFREILTFFKAYDIENAIKLPNKLIHKFIFFALTASL